MVYTFSDQKAVRFSSKSQFGSFRSGQISYCILIVEAPIYLARSSWRTQPVFLVSLSSHLLYNTNMLRKYKKLNYPSPFRARMLKRLAFPQHSCGEKSIVLTNSHQWACHRLQPALACTENWVSSTTTNCFYSSIMLKFAAILTHYFTILTYIHKSTAFKDRLLINSSTHHLEVQNVIGLKMGFWGHVTIHELGKMRLPLPPFIKHF